MFDFKAQETSAETTSLLSVSGGGLLGVIPAAMLVHLEALGKQAHGPQYRLCDSFDSVAGASTGAVIATGVALGLSAQDIADFYLRDVPKGFKRRTTAIPMLHDLFDGDLLQSFFENRTKGRRLTRQDLNCDLTVLTKDLNRGSAVAFTTLTNTPRQILGAEIRSEPQPLAKLLRASTAAPGLFPPVTLQLNGIGATQLVDGGFSLFNDPAYLLTRLSHNQGARQMSLTALGTGSSRPTYKSKRSSASALRAFRGLFGLIKDGENLTHNLMRDLAEMYGPTFDYAQHNMCLSRETFDGMGFQLRSGELRQMRKFADHKGKPRLFEAALIFAEQTISTPLPLAQSNQSAVTIDT